MKILTIDPGKSGGFAWRNEGCAECLAMPETEGDICDFFKGIAKGTVVYLELVTGFVGGVKEANSSTFVQGRNYGFILGCCAAFGLSVFFVTPQKWQKGLGGDGKKGPERKRHLKAVAQQHFAPLGKKVTLKTCDALLMLEYAEAEEAKKR